MFPITTVNSYSNPFYINQKINQIYIMLEKNLTLLSKLQNRISNLYNLNEKITKQFVEQTHKYTPKCPLFQKIPPEQKIIQKIFFKREYKYFLLQKTQLKNPLYKDRNFNIHLALYDIDRNLIINKSNFPLQISIYDATDDIKRIQFTKTRESILKGNTCVDLVEGEALFQKISIREVSSKYEKGLVNLVIYVKSSPFYNLEEIDYKQIRPLVIKDMIVRAKKF